MRKSKVWGSLLSFMLVFTIWGSQVVSASTITQIQNDGGGSSDTSSSTESTSGVKVYDGSALDNPVCDSGYSNSFEGAEYYDMAVPYALTNEQVGGYAMPGGTHVMTDADKKFQIGDRWNIDQAKYDGTANYLYKNPCQNITFSYDDKKMAVATDTNGNEYYLLALPKFFFNNGSVSWGLGNRGYVAELYFTDGTCIRVLNADAKSEAHTNGGIGSNNANSGQDGHTYNYAPLYYKQYQNIYQAYAGEVFEWFTGGGSYKDVPSLVGSSGHVAFVRIYTNICLYDGSPTLASGESKSAITKKSSSGANIGGSSGGVSQGSPNELTGYVGGYYSEMEVSAWQSLVEGNIQAEYLDKATKLNLSQKEISSLGSWQNNIQDSSENSGYIRILRVAVMWLGIIFTLYIFMLYFAFWFDKVNSIIDFDLLGILTLHRLHVAVDEQDVNFSLKEKRDKVYVSHRNMLFICGFGFFFGAMIISGNFYKAISKLVNTILGLIG